ncbi:MAG: hypothetical protein U1B78_03910 [Dehalococcoidia bacterium]|nr:hypothetical protein [Dehalococcoidia bacterium]
MPLVAHLAVLGVLVLDLILGATVVRHFWGRWAATGFEFVLILGYVLFFLQWGVPWGHRGEDEG